MASTAVLAVRIIGDATSGTRALDTTASSADSMQRTLDKASVASGIALAAIGAAAKVAGDAASEAQQAAGGVDSVFGQYSERVKQWASDAAEVVGLSSTSYQTLATVIGSQLKNMGLSLDEATDKTDSLIRLGADLAATFGGTTAEAVSALSSLLRGERDPIERYGVSINQAAIDAEKAARGLSGLTGEADKNATLQATLALLTRQTADASGQFARETDTAAGSSEIARAKWDNAVATLGESLLPLMTAGAGIVGALADAMGQHAGIVTGLTLAAAGLAAGILVVNGAMQAYAAVQAIATAATWASNAAWLANPLTYVILLIAALIAVIVIIVMQLREFSARADESFGPFIDWLVTGYEWAVKLADAIGGFFTGQGFQWGDPPNAGSQARVATQSASSMQSAAPAMARMAVASSMPASSLVAGGMNATPAPAQPAGDTYNVTVNGALDPVAVSRQIEKLLNQSKRETGSGTPGGALWRS